MIIIDIENAYLNTRITEKLCTRLEKYFGQLSFRLIKIIIALFRINSLDQYFQVHLTSTLYHLGFQ